MNRIGSFAKSDSLYLAMEANESTFSSEDGHVILSQKLSAKNEDKGHCYRV